MIRWAVFAIFFLLATPAFAVCPTNPDDCIATPIYKSLTVNEALTLGATSGRLLWNGTAATGALETQLFANAKVRIMGDAVQSIVGGAFQRGPTPSGNFPTGVTGYGRLETGIQGSANAVYSIFSRADIGPTMASPSSAGTAWGETDAWNQARLITSQTLNFSIATNATSNTGTTTPIALTNGGVSYDFLFLDMASTAGLAADDLVDDGGVCVTPGTFVQAVTSATRVQLSLPPTCTEALPISVNFKSGNLLNMIPAQNLIPGLTVVVANVPTGSIIVDITPTYIALNNQLTGTVATSTSVTFTSIPTFTLPENPSFTTTQLFNAAYDVAAFGQYPSAFGVLFDGPNSFDHGIYMASSVINNVGIHVAAGINSFKPAGQPNSLITGPKTDMILENTGDSGHVNLVLNTVSAQVAGNPVLQITDHNNAVQAFATQDGSWNLNKLTASGVVTLSGIPTSAPGTHCQVWSNSGVLTLTTCP